MTNIVVLGDHNPGYLTHREIDAALLTFPADVDVGWVATDDPAAAEREGLDGLWVVPGGPFRDESAVIAALRWARESGTPLLGTCAGFQMLCVELVRNVVGVAGAAHAESEPNAAPSDLVAVPLACSLVGERRQVTCVAGTRVASICGVEPFEGFHFCSFGLDERWVAPLVEAGVVIAARAPDAGVEAIELPEHPFAIATLFQPQMGALDGAPLHPLITAFVEAARGHHQLVA